MAFRYPAVARRGEEVPDVLLQLRRRQRRLRRLVGTLQAIIALLSLVLAGLGIAAYIFDMFGIWIVQTVLVALSIVVAVLTLFYTLLRKLIAQIGRRIRELRGQVTYEVVV